MKILMAVPSSCPGSIWKVIFSLLWVFSNCIYGAQNETYIED